MSASSFAERGVQKCPFCPCSNTCTCPAVSASERRGMWSCRTDVETRIRLDGSSASRADNEETEGRQKDVSVAER